MFTRISYYALAAIFLGGVFPAYSTDFFPNDSTVRGVHEARQRCLTKLTEIVGSRTFFNVNPKAEILAVNLRGERTSATELPAPLKFLFVTRGYLNAKNQNQVRPVRFKLSTDTSPWGYRSASYIVAESSRSLPVALDVARNFGVDPLSNPFTIVTLDGEKFTPIPRYDLRLDDAIRRDLFRGLVTRASNYVRQTHKAEHYFLSDTRRGSQYSGFPERLGKKMQVTIGEDRYWLVASEYGKGPLFVAVSDPSTWTAVMGLEATRGNRSLLQIDSFQSFKWNWREIYDGRAPFVDPTATWPQK